MYIYKGIEFDDRLIATFGIELEGVYSVNDERIKDKLLASDLISPTKLEVGTDSSLAGAGAGYKYEIKYWVKNNPDGVKEMAEMLDISYKISEEFNASCGLHVHFKTIYNNDGGYYGIVSPLLYMNVRRYIVKKYIDTYLNDDIISKISNHNVFVLVKSIVDTYIDIFNAGDNEEDEKHAIEIYDLLRFYLPEDLALLSNNMEKRINLMELAFSSYMGTPYFSFEESKLSNLDEYDRWVIKYALRLVSHYSQTNLLDCVIRDYSHYNFVNLIDSYRSDDTYEFRLMPYADNANEALEEIAFVINTITEAYDKFMKGEIEGYAVKDWNDDGRLSPDNLLLLKKHRRSRVHTRRRVELEERIRENYIIHTTAQQDGVFYR
ncbi:MAG: hypothetical protein QXV17_13830 [Candidatus Micrarchaeaceae archaeon]